MRRKNVNLKDCLIQAETYGECEACTGATDMVDKKFYTYCCSEHCGEKLARKYENKRCVVSNLN